MISSGFVKQFYSNTKSYQHFNSQHKLLNKIVMNTKEKYINIKYIYKKKSQLARSKQNSTLALTLTKILSTKPKRDLITDQHFNLDTLRTTSDEINVYITLIIH